MCTYDYTPYTGCAEGDQHYFIQWVKCGIAAENGRYCSLSTSTRVEKLRELSGNVLSCPLHGPIAVQQYVLEPANARQHDDEGDKRRARSTARRTGVSRGRTPRRDSSKVSEEPARRDIRRQRSRRATAPGSSDSESDGSRSSRARVARRVSGLDNGERPERRSRAVPAGSHRRSTSADIARLPPVPPLSMRYGRSEVSLPLQAEHDSRTDEPRVSPALSHPTRPSLDIPRAPGIIGLPSSPDMHRRASVRTQSEGQLRNGEATGPRSAASPASDSSPDHDPNLPFSSPGRRGRRTAARSIRDRSVDTTMRRIDEHVVAGDTDLDAAARSPTTTTHPDLPYAPTRSPPIGLGIPHTSHRRAKSASKPQLDSLTIPKPGDKHQREAYSAPTATPPETDITERPASGRAKSLRNVEVDLASSTAPLGHALPAARASSSNLPVSARESVDSGYLSGHHCQGHSQSLRGWESLAPADPAVAGGNGKGGGKSGRNTLQKTPPQQLGQGQGQSQDQAQTQQADKEDVQRPKPAPLDLSLPGAGAGAAPAGPGHGLPPCALPVSLLSPGCQSDTDVSPGGAKGGRVTLLQRMGLKRKISGLLWDRAGQREVGVEG